MQTFSGKKMSKAAATKGKYIFLWKSFIYIDFFFFFMKMLLVFFHKDGNLAMSWFIHYIG